MNAIFKFLLTTVRETLVKVCNCNKLLFSPENMWSRCRGRACELGTLALRRREVRQSGRISHTTTRCWRRRPSGDRSTWDRSSPPPLQWIISDKIFRVFSLLCFTACMCVCIFSVYRCCGVAQLLLCGCAVAVAVSTWGPPARESCCCSCSSVAAVVGWW